MFIVHARNAVLKGLSPRDNREIPPLRYDLAAKLQVDFPDATFILNGGITQCSDALELSQQFDGVMLGRAAWHNPGILSDLHRAIWPDVDVPALDDVIDAMVDYACLQCQAGTPLRFITRAMLGLASGRPGARQWRRSLSDAKTLNQNDPELLRKAWAALTAA